MEKNSVRFLKGVGEKKAEKLAALGIFTISDLLYHLPRGYLDYSEMTPIEEIRDQSTVLVKGTVSSDVRCLRRGNLDIFEFEVIDKEDSFGVPRMSVTLFNRNYLAEKITRGTHVVLYGKAEIFGNKISMRSPEIEFAEDTERGFRPIYPLTEGISLKNMQKTMSSALAYCFEKKDGKIISKTDIVKESLPQYVMDQYGLCALPEAFYKIHKPQTKEDIAAARRRLAFEEILIFRLGLSTMKQKMKKQRSKKMTVDFDFPKFASALPYKMTNAQKRTIKEAIEDMKRPYPMSRVIQGDVGSGKTVVAAALCFFAFQNGCQSSIMVPTEVLAAQHYSDLKPLLETLGMTVSCLTGSNTKKEKEQIKEDIRSGNTDLVIGTHALIEKDVKFKNLALAVTDEQHRFGVRQRETLSKKGEDGTVPHALVMSATPIPRSLALIIYGDMDISVIDEMPPGRQKVSTFLLPSSENSRMYSYISQIAKKGKQAYIVCPMVEEGESEEIKAVESFAAELQENYLQGIRLAFLHGRMKGKEKDSILKKFAYNEISVLVSTTVIEVGINVPNAVVMIIQNAERFGLSQLHQLRGRVGRGKEKSYCFLISDSKNEETRERMKAFCKTNDGFEISRKDLEIRGPGEIFGKRQHGLPEFKIADIASDTKLIREVQECVERIISDPLWFDKDQNKPLKERVQAFFTNADRKINGLQI